MPPEAMGGGRNAPVMPELSGKMFVLYRLMREMRKQGNGNDVRINPSNCFELCIALPNLTLFLSHHYFINHRKS